MDFTVMEQFFPKRNRKQLLRKFHKEKKKNPRSIESALQQNQKMTSATAQRCKWLLNSSNDLTFSGESNSSFDSTDQVLIWLTVDDQHPLEEYFGPGGPPRRIRWLGYKIHKLLPGQAGRRRKKHGSRTTESRPAWGSHPLALFKDCAVLNTEKP